MEKKKGGVECESVCGYSHLDNWGWMDFGVGAVAMYSARLFQSTVVFRKYEYFLYSVW